MVEGEERKCVCKRVSMRTVLTVCVDSVLYHTSRKEGGSTVAKVWGGMRVWHPEKKRCATGSV